MILSLARTLTSFLNNLLRESGLFSQASGYLNSGLPPGVVRRLNPWALAQTQRTFRFKYWAEALVSFFRFHPALKDGVVEHRCLWEGDPVLTHTLTGFLNNLLRESGLFRQASGYLNSGLQPGVVRRLNPWALTQTQGTFRPSNTGLKQ